MRIGIIIPGGGMPLAAVVGVAREAEAVGLDGVWVTEAWRSAFVPLTAIAVATERITDGTYGQRVRPYTVHHRHERD